MSNNPEYAKVGECLYRNTNSGIYYGLVKRSGKQIRRSLKTKDRKLAERKLADFRKAVDRLSKRKEDKNRTFKELADSWHRSASAGKKEKTNLRRKNAIDNLNRYFGIKTIRDISTRDCENWKVHRSTQNISASSFNKEREALISVLDVAVRDGLLLENPAASIERRKLSQKQLLIPTKEQFEILLTTVRAHGKRTERAANLIELLAYSGMRLNEATSILWGDIDFNANRFKVTGGQQGTKNHEERFVPLFPIFNNFLLKLLEAIPGKPKQTAPISEIGTAKNIIDNACKTAALLHFNHHSMRHYFVSNAIEKGVDFKTIAAWVGHKDGGLLVAKTYGHLRDTHSIEMAKLIS